MSNISKLLGLARQMAELTDSSMEEALLALDMLDKPAPVPAPQPQPAPKPAIKLAPFNKQLFAAALERARPGAEYTAIELVTELGMEFEGGSKGPSYQMKEAGWVHTNTVRSFEGRTNGVVWRKPYPNELAMFQAAQ